MKATRRTFLAGGTALTAIVLGNLPQRATAQSGGEVNLYSSRHYDTDEELYSSFMNGDVEVNLIEDKAGKLIERIEAEGRLSPADLLLTVDAGNLWKADQKGLFEPVNSRVLNSKVPENYRHSNGHWFGFSTRGRILYYNPQRLAAQGLELPDTLSYEDLSDSKWRGEILIRSSNNIYNQSLVASLIANSDAETTKTWLEGFTANFARDPQSNDTGQLKACAAGEGAIAIANTYYYARQLKKAAEGDAEAIDIVSKVTPFFPNQKGRYDRGFHVNISGGGVLKNAPNKRAAIAFLEHLVDTNSQSLFAEGNNEYPIVERASLSGPLVEMDTNKKKDTITPVEEYGINQEQAIQLMDQVGWA